MESAIVSLPELQDFAKECAKKLHGGEVLALVGDLGAGKTTFSKALLRALGVRSRITSPTFGIMTEYSLGRRISHTSDTTAYHVDLYRISGSAEFETLGVRESWQQPQTIYIIEWADKIARKLPKNTVIMRFSRVAADPAKRKISIRTL